MVLFLLISKQDFCRDRFGVKSDSWRGLSLELRVRDRIRVRIGCLNTE